MVYFPIIVIVALIVLAVLWNRIRVNAYGKFYKSNLKWTIEGGERVEENKDFSTVIWSDEVNSKELITLLKQNPSS